MHLSNEDKADWRTQGTRNVVAECLGKLVVVDPAKLLPELASKLSSESTFTRCTVVRHS